MDLRDEVPDRVHLENPVTRRLRAGVFAFAIGFLICPFAAHGEDAGSRFRALMLARMDQCRGHGTSRRIPRASRTEKNHHYSPRPTPRERRHRALARRGVAVRRRARYAAGGGGGGFGGLVGGGFGGLGGSTGGVPGYAQQGERIRRIGILFGGFSDTDPEPRYSSGSPTCGPGLRLR
jgi:hypothetical protein